MSPHTPQTPPEEAFWQRYSAHHEFPLSTVTSVALFGLAAGLAALAAVLVGLSRHGESHQPVRQDVVVVAEPGAADAGGPAGAEAGPAGRERKVENVGPKRPTQEPVARPRPLAPPVLPGPHPRPVTLPKQDSTTDKSDPSADFDDVMRDIDRQLKNPPGPGGTQTPGPGPKPGSRPGPGGNPNGGTPTQRQRRELRWRIDFSGTGEQHLEKLRALGVTLALPTRARGQFLVLDLTRQPPAGKTTDLGRQRDKIKWLNRDQGSLRELARALGMRDVPPFAVIFLPRVMEDEMIRLEHDYKGLEESQIELTEFEIQRRGDGTFGPVVIGQHRRPSS
jgi:hypothetical protein